jgi:hypothetical protein
MRSFQGVCREPISLARGSWMLPGDTRLLVRSARPSFELPINFTMSGWTGSSPNRRNQSLALEVLSRYDAACVARDETLMMERIIERFFLRKNHDLRYFVDQTGFSSHPSHHNLHHNDLNFLPEAIIPAIPVIRILPHGQPCRTSSSPTFQPFTHTTPHAGRLPCAWVSFKDLG